MEVEVLNNLFMASNLAQTSWEWISTPLEKNACIGAVASSLLIFGNCQPPFNPSDLQIRKGVEHNLTPGHLFIHPKFYHFPSKQPANLARWTLTVESMAWIARARLAGAPLLRAAAARTVWELLSALNGDQKLWFGNQKGHWNLKIAQVFDHLGHAGLTPSHQLVVSDFDCLLPNPVEYWPTPQTMFARANWTIYMPWREIDQIVGQCLST